MNILKTLCKACIVLMFVNWPIMAVASDDASVTVHDSIIVTANRYPVESEHSARDVFVVSGEEIRQTPARDVAEALSYIPAVDVQINGFPGRATALSINGSSARHVLLMVDGIPFNTQLSGQANPTQIPVEFIDRIEVLKGPASSSWGSSLGGVVNVITKDVGTTERPTGKATTSFAEFGTFRNSLELAGAVKRAGYYVTASHYESDGPRPISEVQETNGFGKIKVPLADDLSVTGQFGYVTSDSRYAGPVSTAITSQPYRTRYGQLKLENNGEKVGWSVAVKTNEQYIRTDTLSIPSEAVLFSTRSTNFYKGLSLNGRMDFDEYGVTVVGFDYDHHRLKSNNFLSSSKDVSMRAPYFNHTLSVEDWDFILGLRYDDNDRFGSQLSPSLGVVYFVDQSTGTLIRARIARAFNAPPLLWLFNDDPGLFVGANPDLKAERSTNYEVGVETNFRDLGVKLNLYRADVRDAIALVFDSTNFVFVQRNFREFKRQGVELLLDYDVTNEITVYASGAFNDVKNKQTDEKVRDAGVARQKFTFGGRYRNQHGLSCHLYGYYNRWASRPTANANDRKPIFDFRVAQKFEDVTEGIDIELFANVHNLTNSKYWADEDFPLAERYFEGGMSINF